MIRGIIFLRRGTEFTSNAILAFADKRKVDWPAPLSLGVAIVAPLVRETMATARQWAVSHRESRRRTLGHSLGPVAFAASIIESFNGRLRDALLNETLFPSLAHARATLADWRDDYNVDRLHSGIGWQTPNEYATTFAPQRGLTLRTMTSSAPAPVAQTAQKGQNEPRSLAQVG